MEIKRFFGNQFLSHVIYKQDVLLAIHIDSELKMPKLDLA